MKTQNARPEMPTVESGGLAGQRVGVASCSSNTPCRHWMTCYENVHLGARRVFGAGEDAAALRRRTEHALNMVHLEDAAAKYPFEISGGMKQRVGIARALAIEPRVLLYASIARQRPRVYCDPVNPATGARRCQSRRFPRRSSFGRACCVRGLHV